MKVSPDSARRQDRSSDAIALVACLVVSFALYARVMHAGFVNDDLVLIHSVSTKGPFGHFTLPPTDYFRPLVSLVFWLEWRLFGLEPTGYHVVNIVLYGLCGFGLWLVTQPLFRNIGAADALVPRALAVIAFLALPSHVEPVAWAAGISDVGAAMFVLSALCFVLLDRIWIAAILFAFGLCFKETSVALILVAPMVLRYVLDQPWRIAIKRSVPVSAIGLAYVAVRQVVVSAGANHASLVAGASLSRVPANLIYYPLRAVVGPVDLALAGKPLEENAFKFMIRFLTGHLPLLVGLLVIGILAAFLFARQVSRLRAVPAVLVAGLAFYCFVGPTIALFVAPNSCQNERYLFMPSAFLVIGLTYAFVRLRTLYLVLGGGVVVGALSISLFASQSSWNQGAAFAQRVYSRLPEVIELAAGRNRVVLLNAPDTLRGYPVAGDCLQQAMAVMYPGRAVAIDQVAVMDLADVDAGASFSGNTLSLGPECVFESIQPSTDLLARYRIEQLGPRQLSISRASGSDEAFAVFSRGHFVVAR